jgi:phage terminase large subunit-like protein
MKVDNQNPSFTNVTLTNKTKTFGTKAVKIYAGTGQTLMIWQQRQIKAIMEVDSKGQWKHINYCIGLSRRNGKGEVLAAREMFGLLELGEKICHTAHRTTTSHDAFNRLYTLLKKAGYEEFSKKKKEMPEHSFFASKQYGLERIEVVGGGIIDFRTRTNNGGLGEGFDLLVIDEAQEYTSKQESSLLYTVSASKNPQIIMVGTPPTVNSGGDVFVRIRESVLNNMAPDTGWAEWSTPEMVEADKINDPALWERYNPSYGKLLKDRVIRNELTGDILDFNVQRLGFWCSYNQKSEISQADWNELKVDKFPELKDKRYVGIKYGKDGVNVSLSIASRTTDGHIFVESVDCVSVRAGNGWIFEYLYNPKVDKVAIDGASGQQLLATQMREHGIKKPPILPKVGEIISANAMFEQAIYSKEIVHRGQESLSNVVTNCKKRLIGSQGGFGYQSLIDTQDVSLMDSMILAYWLCATTKEVKPKQAISY